MADDPYGGLVEEYVVDKPVLLVEGETRAACAARLFPSIRVLAWSLPLDADDWATRLVGDVALIWPSARPGGLEAAYEAKEALADVPARLLDIPTALLPPGWARGAPIPADFDPGPALALLEAAAAPELGKETDWPPGFFEDGRSLYWRPEEKKPPVRLCARPDVLGLARDQFGSNWTTVLSFADREGRQKTVLAPHADLAAGKVDVFSRLAGMGLSMRCDKLGREKLATAIIGVRTPRLIELAYSCGWHGDAYVLPGVTIGARAEPVIYDGPPSASFHGHRGSAEAWRTEVAGRAPGNAVLLFCLSAAFAAKLLTPLGAEGGGFHLRGGSSVGKTASLIVAGSVDGGGGPLGFCHTWRATPNAVEAIACAHNDGLLSFDEIKTLGGDAAGEAAYALATGQMKGRLTDRADLRARRTWRTYVLSSGEISLAQLIASGKNRDHAFAGQELRLVDLDVEIERVGEAWSAFQAVDVGQTHAEFAREITAMARAHYGHAGPAFVEAFLGKREWALGYVQEKRREFLKAAHQRDDTGQITRTADRFAIVAAAGELAAELRIVPWIEGEAFGAASLLFERWAAAFGRRQPREHLQALEAVQGFLARFGESRFRRFEAGSTQDEAALGGSARNFDEAGWRREQKTRDDDGVITVETTWFIHPSAWRNEICKGRDPTNVARAVKLAGHLLTDGGDERRLTKKLWVPGGGARSFYGVRDSIMAEAEFEPADD
ncbi:MAG TPA: DUF927 domain-containing protein [Caulobacteraceae bacterium]|nr:DUF927 domain-containing protein [Caulobacteraceae bacterium]